MRLVALTGNIASGKSIAAERLAELGATIIDADILAREAVRAGSPALARITEKWGESVLDDEGSLDRAALRSIVFSDQGDLDALNDIIHPEVVRLRDAEFEAARARGDRVVVYVVPLLFERHLADQFTTIVLVDAPRDMRLERLVRDRGLEEAEAMNMIAAQMPAELKRARADYVIENDGSMAQLREQVDKLWAELAGDDVSSRRTADVP